MHFEDKKLKKAGKLGAHSKKMILINYRDHSIYQLYDKKINLIFISCSVDINENSMLKKITAAEVFKIESFTAEFNKSLFIKLTDSFNDSFINFFIKSFMTDSSPQNDELIIKNVAPPVRTKDKKRMSSSSSQTEVLKTRHSRKSTKKNIVNSMIMSVMIIK